MKRFITFTFLFLLLITYTTLCSISCGVNQKDFIKEATSLPSEKYEKLVTVRVTQCELRNCEPIIDAGPILEIKARESVPGWPTPRPDLPESAEIIVKMKKAIENKPYPVYLRTLPDGKVFEFDLSLLEPGKTIYDDLAIKDVTELEFYFYSTQ